MGGWYSGYLSWEELKLNANCEQEFNQGTRSLLTDVHLDTGELELKVREDEAVAGISGYGTYFSFEMSSCDSISTKICEFGLKNDSLACGTLH